MNNAAVMFGALSSVLYSGVLIAGLLLVKMCKAWWQVFLVVLGAVAFIIAMNMGSYFLQGTDRALQMLPGGEMFHFVGLPMMINTLITVTALFTAVYGLFVAQGRELND